MRCERKFIGKNEAGGNHVGGKNLEQTSPQHFRSADVAVGRNQIRDELSVAAWHRPRTNDGVFHFGLPRQRCFDFRNFNPVAVDLHPRVLAIHEHERAIGRAATEITAAKHAQAVRATVFRKTFGGQQFVPPVTGRKITAAHDDFAGFTGGNFPAVFIEQQDFNSLHLPPDRQPALVKAVILSQAMLGDVAGLGRGKGIEQNTISGKMTLI